MKKYSAKCGLWHVCVCLSVLYAAVYLYNVHTHTHTLYKVLESSQFGPLYAI